MRHQYTVPIIEFKNKLLMTRTLIIISQYAGHATAGLKPQPRTLCSKGLLHHIATSLQPGINSLITRLVILVNNQPRHNQQWQQPVS